MKRRIPQWMARFVGQERASAIVEMALAVPILLILILAGVEVTRYVLLNQKVSRAATSMGDLVSQAETVSTADLNGLFQAAAYIMEPFKLQTDGSVVISSIVASAGKSTIVWQKALGGGGASKYGVQGATAVLPKDFTIRDGESVIAAETFYSFKPLFGGQYLKADTLYATSVYKPRFTAQVKFSG